MNVRNPLTGRYISTRGTLFRQLVGPTGRYFYDDNENALHPFPTVIITHIRDPSSGDVIERYHEEVIRTDAQYEAYEAALDGEPIVGLFRDPWYDRSAYIVQMTRGEDMIEMEMGGNGYVRAIAGRPDLVRSNTPKSIPITNINMNIGEDDQCVVRWLGPEFESRNGLTYREVITRASHSRMNVQLMDVYGEVIAQSDNFGMYDGLTYRAILFQGHVYPFKNPNQSQVKYVTAPVHHYKTDSESLAAVLGLFPESNSAFWRMSGAYMFRDHGVYRREVLSEDWMREFLEEFVPRSKWTWDVVLLRKFLYTTNALYTFDPSIADKTYEDLNVMSGYMTLDMNKCYYHTALKLGDPECTNFYGGIPNPDPFVLELEEGRTTIHELQHRSNNAWFVKLPPEILEHVHTALGLSMDVVSVQTWRQILRYYNGDYEKVRPVKVWPFKGLAWPAHASEKMRTFSDEQRKKFAVIVGLMQDAVSVDVRELELPEEFVAERLHYANTWNMVAYPGAQVIVGRTEKISPRNRAHYRMAIVHAANALVIEKIVDLRLLLRAEPLLIRTDGLLYEKTPFYGRDVADYAPGWKIEPVNKPVRVGHYGRREFDEQCYYRGTDLTQKYRVRNKIYTGAPGTGKTVSAQRNQHDLIITMTNRNAVRLGGMTVYAAFGVRPDNAFQAFNTASCERFRDKTIVVDEAQQFPRFWYTLFTFLFHRFNTRFIFTMDSNQLSSIEDSDEEPIWVIPFHGAHVHLTYDHRNDEALQVARAEVLNGTFQPRVLLGAFDPENFAKVNVCAHVLTRRYVNDSIVANLNLKFGDPGRYIVQPDANMGMQTRQLRMQRGQLLIVEPGDHLIFRDMEDRDKWYDFRDLATVAPKIIKWGFAITTHTLIGATIREPMCIWDWDAWFTNNSHGMLYTAITRATHLANITFRKEPVHCRSQRARQKKRPRHEEEGQQREGPGRRVQGGRQAHQPPPEGRREAGVRIQGGGQASGEARGGTPEAREEAGVGLTTPLPGGT